MSEILVEANGIWHLYRHRPDFHPDSQIPKSGQELPVKVRDRSRSQGDLLDLPPTRLQDEFVMPKIEFNCKRAVFIGHRRSGKSARAKVKSYRPIMVDQRRQREPYFTDH